jgi:hypothetical protein
MKRLKRFENIDFDKDFDWDEDPEPESKPRLIDKLIEKIKRKELDIEPYGSGFYIMNYDNQERYYTILPINDRPEEGWYINSEYEDEEITEEDIKRLIELCR